MNSSCESEPPENTDLSHRIVERGLPFAQEPRTSGFGLTLRKPVVNKVNMFRFQLDAILCGCGQGDSTRLLLWESIVLISAVNGPPSAEPKRIYLPASRCWWIETVPARRGIVATAWGVIFSDQVSFFIGNSGISGTLRHPVSDNIFAQRGDLR